MLRSGLSTRHEQHFVMAVIGEGLGVAISANAATMSDLLSYGQKKLPTGSI